MTQQEIIKEIKERIDLLQRTMDFHAQEISRRLKELELLQGEKNE